VKQINVGIVGIGKIARDQHIPVLRANPSFRLSACASRNARVDGVANYPSLSEMLDAQPGIDAVTICTPPQFHYEAARLALARGKHVFLEKPPCATTVQLELLALQARNAGRTLFQSWHSRHAAGVDVARDWLRNRVIRTVRVIWKEDVRLWHPGQDWIWQAGGFGVFDPGINAISILTKILPGPIFVTSAELFIPENCDAPIAADVGFSTEGGTAISAVFDFRHTGIQTWDIDIETDDGVMKLAEGGNALFIDDRRAPVDAPHSEYASLYRHFERLVGNNLSDVDAVPFQLVADAFLVGKRVTVDRFDE
jgi:D-galactose 1-dehydrogenase